MDMDILAQYCLSKKGTRQEYPFGPEAAVMKVGSKMFALLSVRNQVQQISLKCDPHIAESLRQQYTSVQPGYHLNKTHWNTVILDGGVEPQEVCQMIDHSYDLVYKGLKKSEKEALQ